MKHGRYREASDPHGHAPRRRRRALRAAVAVLTALVTLAACSSTSDGAAGSDPTDTNAGTPTTSSAETPVTVPTLTSPSADDSGSATPSDGAAPGTEGSETAASGTAASDTAASDTGSASTDPSTSTPTTPTTTTEPEPVATISAKPAFGSTDVSVLAPFTVTVAHGTITDFTLRNATGEKVKGAISDDRHRWKLGEVLGYGKTYTATGTALGTDGKTVPIKGSFSTLTPASTVNARINIGDGAVVGVATPIVVTFDGVEPADRALIEKHISVTTDPKVEGAWGWINHDGGVWGLDYRTKEFWPAGTEIHVEAKIYGLPFGGGRYGAADITSDFTIGRNQVVYADVNSHQLVVKRDGKVTATYPASYGRGTDYYTTTRSGIHVINDKDPFKLMSNPRYGYEDFPAKWAVRISNNGEFIHANDGTVGDQGSTNVSHGCVNLSTANAKEFYDSSLYGDPVIVSGTDVQLSPSDGDIFDWAIPWSQWVTLSALR